jgi:hypothetical protein
MMLKPGRCYIHDLLIEAELTSGTYVGAHKYVLLSTLADPVEVYSCLPIGVCSKVNTLE